MEEKLGEYSLKAMDTDLEEKFSEKTESNQVVRKSSRPRKQSKRVLDSADSDDIDLVGIPAKKKHRRDVKLKTGQKKDILSNGRPFKCSLCESPYINNSPAKAKVKKELQPIIKEKFGQLLQLCVKCAIAVNHTENKGPTPEQRAEFEEEGKQFAQHLVKYLNDSAAARLYCSFYQTTKCGCIQSYITGTPANRKKKTSLSGTECGISDTAEVKQEDAGANDEKEQAQRASYLLSLLKESMAKKQAPATKKSIEKSQQTSDDASNVMKESEKFILANRVKLKELGICERGCQKVLCYSNNFLHKKSVGSQPRLQRTKGRAALGRLISLQDLQKMRCCDKNCVKMAEREQDQVEHWRHRAKQGQKEMWRVLEEMLTFTGNTNCYKFISMVTGCCLTTVQKVYADVLLSRGTAGGATKREHGMRFHWKRQKELGKSHRGQIVTTPPDKPQQLDLGVHGQSAASDSALYTSQAGFSSVVKENLSCSTHQVMPENKPSVEESKDKEDIKEKFLQLFENIEDPKVIASMQQILDTLQKDLKIKQGKELIQQETTTISLQIPGAAAASVPSVSASSSVSLVSNILQTPPNSSNLIGILSEATEDMQAASIATSRLSKPFVHMKVQQALPTEQKTSVKQIPHISNREHRVLPTTSKTGQDLMQSAANSAKEIMQSGDLYSAKTETSIAQIFNQPIVLSSFASHSNLDRVETKSCVPSSHSSVIGTSTISSILGTPSMTVSSTAETNLDQLPQHVSLFQIVPHPESGSSQLPSQIISVYPPPTPLQMQQIPMPSNSNTQHIQFQLVSPLVMGQSELMIPLNQSDTLSFILPKQTPSALQNHDSSSDFHVHPQACSSSALHKDPAVTQMSALQQSFKNIPALLETLSDSNERSVRQVMSDFQTQTGCNLEFSNNTCNVQQTKQDGSLLSLKSEVHKIPESIDNQIQRTLLDQNSGSVTSLSDLPSSSQTVKPQHSSSGSSTQSVAVLNLQSIQNSGHEGEAVYQVNGFDQYFPSSFLGQTQGTILVGTPSSSSSGSFVFDALADSPVKDSFSLSSPLLQPVPFATSSILCDMLMHSTASSVSCNSSPSDLFLSTTLSSLPLLSCGPQTQVQSSQNSISVKPPLLTPALKSSPVTSSYCQSLNFSTHTTPSVMSNQPIVTSGKIEQTSPAASTTIGHSPSFSHSQISVNRPNRQREPQVGIVHPHISGVKTGSGHIVNSLLNNSSISISNNNIPNSSSSVAPVNSCESLPSASSSSLFFSLDNANYQVASSAQELTANQSQTQQQHLLLPLLLSSQQTGQEQQHTLRSLPQQASDQITLASFTGSSVSSLAKTNSLSERLYQGQVFDSGFQNNASTGDCNTSLVNTAKQGNQNFTRDSSNLLSHQTPVSTGDQTNVSPLNQNIISGGPSSNLDTSSPHMYHSVMCSNTGQVKLIPLVLSEGNASVPGLFQQDGQLLWNMSPYTGFNSFSSLSPQSLIRNTNMPVHTPASSSQNTSGQQPTTEAVSNAQTSSILPLQSPSIQNVQYAEVSPQPKDQNENLQANVTPFGNQPGNDYQLLSQTKSQRDSNLALSGTHDESQNVHKLPRNFLKPLLNSVAPVIGKVSSLAGQSLTQTSLPGTSTSEIIYGKGEMIPGKDTNFQSIYPSAGQNIFVPVSESQPKVSTNSEVVYKAGTTISGVASSCQVSETKNFGLASSHEHDCQNKKSYCDSQAEGKLHISYFNNQSANDEHLRQQQSASTTSISQQQQLPLQVVSVLQMQGDQASNDEALPPRRTKNLVLGQPTFHNTGIGQAFLNIPGPNQIFLPVQYIPIHENLGLDQTHSNTAHAAQVDPHIPELPKVLLQSSSSGTPSDPNALVTLIPVTKHMSTSCTSVQSTITNSGSQPTITSKHRPIRPKLQPVPPAPQKISLMLVPDKPGYPAYQLAQLDQTLLPVPQISEQCGQKDRTQQSQNTFLFPGNTQQSQNANLVQGNSQQPQNANLVQGKSQQSQNAMLVSGNSQNSILIPGNTQQPQYTIFVPGSSQESQNTILVPGNTFSAQGNSQDVPGNTQQSKNILVPLNSPVVAKNSQESHNVVLVPGNSQRPMNAILVPGNTQQSPNSLLVQENSQQLLNAILVPGNSQQLLNTILVPGNSLNSQNSPLVIGKSHSKNKPTANAASNDQLQTNKTNQQPNEPALLDSHTGQEANTTDKNLISRNENEILQLSLQHTRPIFQVLPKAGKESQAASHQASEIISQQTMTAQSSSYQMTSVAFSSPETTLVHHGTSENSFVQNGSIQTIPSQNKRYQVGVFQNGSFLVSSLQDETFPADHLHGQTFEVSNLQSSGSLLQNNSLCSGSLEVSESGTLKSATSQVSSLISKCASVRQTVQSDIQRLNPQVAAQLSGDLIIVTPQKHLNNNASSNRQPDLTMTLSSQNIQPNQSELRENRLQSVRSHAAMLDLTPGSHVQPSHNILLQPKLTTKDITMQALEEKVLVKTEGDATQSSYHRVSSNTFMVQSGNVPASCGSGIPVSIPTESAILPSEAFVSTKLTQSPAITVGRRTSSTREEIKPAVEPTQYLQCKEVIDLTEDSSPPVSPPRGSQNKDTVFGVVPILSGQPSIKCNELQRQMSNSHSTSQQNAKVIQSPYQNLFQHNQLEKSHYSEERNRLKANGIEICKAQTEITPDILSDELSVQIVDKNDQSPNLVMIEDIPENIRQELIASLEAHAAGNPDVHLVTRTFTPNEELSYQGFLCSKGSSQQTEDQLNAITKAISRNKCPSAVVTISTSQRFQQSLARAKTQGPPVSLMSLAADNKIDKLNLVSLDGRTSQTPQRSVSGQSNPQSSLSSTFGSANNLKQKMDMPSTGKVLSRSSSTASSSSDGKAVVQSDLSSLSIISSLIANSLPATTSSPSLVLTPLSTSPATKTTAGRSVVHPIALSTVAFMRTTNTPTDAVGPPNITIMSPAQASSAPLLRFRHENNSVSTIGPALSQPATGVCLNPVPMTTLAQTSGLLKFSTSTSTTSVPVKVEGSQDVSRLALLLCPSSKEKSAGLLGRNLLDRRLSLENISQTSCPKEIPVLETSSPSSGVRSVGNLIKSFESPAPTKPKTRKKSTTVMDLLRNKEKLQASASPACLTSVPVSSGPGPVTLMISGAAGTPNLLVRDSATGQSRVDPNSLNITVKNLQLLGKLTANTDTNVSSNQIPSINQPSGFTILQPNVLPASVFNTATVSGQVTSLPVVEQISTTTSAPSLNTSHLPNHAMISKSANGSHNITLSAQKYTNSKQFLENLTKGQQNESNETGVSNQISASHSRSVDQSKVASVPSVRQTSFNETFIQASGTFGQESALKHNHTHEVIKTENSVQLQMVGQPQVASVSLHPKAKSPALDLLAQKSHTTLADMFIGEKLKFKTTSTRNRDIEFKQEEMVSQKLQPDNLQKNQSTQSTGIIKKLLLLNKSPNEVQSNPFIKPSLQLNYNEGQATFEQKQLSLKSPQLLQLMKSNQPNFAHGSPDQMAQSSSISHSPGSDKPHQLKLPRKPASMAVNVDADVHMTRPSIGASVMTNETKHQRDLLHAVPNVQSRTVDQVSLSEQNPLLANILCISNSSNTSSHISTSFSTGKSSLQYETQTKYSVDWRNRYEKNLQQPGVLSQDSPTSSEHLLEGFLLENIGERSLKQGFEKEIKSNVEASIVLKAPPAYSQPPRYEVAAKEMTRVNRVIKDIYKFTDEGDESSPPSPVYGGYKPQALSPKGKIVHSSHRKISNSPYEINRINQSFHPSDGIPNSTGAFPETTLYDYVPAGHPHSWRSSKKLKTKKHNDKHSCKFNSKKVQFSDIVTSKVDSDCGQSVSGSSDIDALPNEIPANQLQDHNIAKDRPDLSRSQNPWDSNPGRHQNSPDSKQADQVGHDRYPHMAETEVKESRLRASHSDQTEAIFKRSETQPGNKDKFGKALGMTYIPRENDSFTGTDFGHHNGREAHKELLHQNFSKINQKTLSTTLSEQGLKERGERDVIPQQEFRRIEENLHTFSSGFINEDPGKSGIIRGKIEANLHSVQDTRCSEQIAELFREGNKIYNAGTHGKSESSIRDSKRRQLVHSESFQFSTFSDPMVHMAERKHYMAEKKELIPPSPDSGISGSIDRDSDLDQQSSFNILSTQGYSKLFRQRLNRTQSGQPSLESSTHSTIKNTQFPPQGFSTNDTSCSSDQYEEVRDLPYQSKSDIVHPNITAAENLDLDRQPSESPLIRQKMLESNFELAQQMKKGQIHILKDSSSDTLNERELESPHKFIVYSDRGLEGLPTGLVLRDSESQLSKELEFRALSGPSSRLNSPIFTNSLDGRSDVLSSIESLNCLRKEIKTLEGENQYLKLEVAKAEKEKEQQRQRQLSSSDKQRSIAAETDKIYYASPSGANFQAYTADNESVMPPRKRHPSSTLGLYNNLLNNLPSSGCEAFRQEEGFQKKGSNIPVAFSGIQPGLETDTSFLESSFRSLSNKVFYSRIDDYSPPETYTRDPFVSSSIHRRPASQLDFNMPQYESARHRYPSSEMRPMSSRGISDGDGFVPLQDHTRHRNLSSSLGLRALSDIDPPSYDMTQRQRNLSASSVKSSYQDADLPSFDLGTRSRNPSSSSWMRYFDENSLAVRSRNPSGSSNRRSRPGSSSSDRELPVSMDELPLFPDIARTRSRNSSGESIEPTVEFLDPQQFIQYAYPMEAHIKRTKH